MTAERQAGDGRAMVRGGATRRAIDRPDGGEDDRLVALVLAGDRAAFAAIVARHREPLYRLAQRRLGDADAADDATQETFTRAYVHLACYRAGSSLRSWLAAITDHWCLDQLRHRQIVRRRMAQLETLELGERVGDDSPEERVLRAELRGDIRRRIADLPEHYRRILALRYEDELSYDEIGAALDSPVSVVRMRLFRARRHLAHGVAPGAPRSAYAGGGDRSPCPASTTRRPRRASAPRPL